MDIGGFVRGPIGLEAPGKRYEQTGEAQARAMLTDLAVHPATARHLTTKLARHFVADEPPTALVDRLRRRMSPAAAT